MARDAKLSHMRIDELINVNTTMKMKSEFVYANTFKEYLETIYREEILVRDYENVLLAYDNERAYAYIKEHDKFHFITCTKSDSSISHTFYKEPVEKMNVNVKSIDPLVIESVDISIRGDQLKLINSNNDVMFNRFISKL